MEALLRDAYYAMRRLAKAPAFSVTAIVVLAIGIGATTSIFTLAYALLWKPLPVRAPEALYRLGNEPHCCYLGGYSQDGEFSLVSYELYEHLRDHTAGFSELAAFQAFPNAAFGVRSPGSDQAATALPGALVSGNYFAMLGVTASAGRLLTAEDDRAGAAPVVVLGYSRWQREYGADPAIVGKVIDINGQPFTVAGVAPAGFFGTSLSVRPPELFLPLHAEPLLMADAEIGHPATHWLDVMGRLAPGAEPAAIEAAMRLELTQWLRSHSSDMNDRDRALLDRQTLYLSPGGTGIPLMRAQYQRWLAMLGLISAFVLLIVCANLANLLLVRGMKRRPQTAVSVALGASTWALVRQALTESLLLALLGGAASLGVAALATRLILSFAFPSSEGLSAPAIEWPSAPVLPFALAVSTFVGVAFGLAPALIAARTQPLAALRGRGPSERGSSLPRRALVVCQAALSLVLLCATGLLTAAIHELEHQDFGFDRDGRTVVRIEPRLAGYEPARLPALYARVRETTSSIPGVAAVAVALHSPQSGDRWGARVFVDGAPPPAPGAANLALWNRATAGYFDVIGSRIIRGRGITTEDTATSRRVAVVNEAFAKAYLADRDPIGSRFGLEPQASRELEIVGVVEDARYDAQDPAGPIRPFFVVAEAQAPYTQNLGSLFLHDIVVRTSPGVSVSTEQLRGAIAAADPTVPVLWIRTLDRQVASQLNGQRLVARLATVFGAIAVLLSCVGLYGLTAYDVASRNAEIAMRMALGAHPTRVLQLVLQDAMTLVACALVVGLPLAFAVGVSLGSELYGVSPFDPLVATLAVLALALTTFVAALTPAVRAMRVSPVAALRCE